MQNSLNEQIVSVIKNFPVQQAWLFGSYSRNEQHASSDIDLLVRFIPGSKIGLFGYSRLINLLSETTGKNVDVVEDGFLKEFAQASAKKDKILIYERKA